MPDKTWKANERRIAAKFGTTRNPLSGGNSGHTRSDTLHPRLFIEIKQRKRIPFWKDFQAAREMARKEGKMPLFVMHQTGTKDDILMMSLQDFLDIVDTAKAIIKAKSS